MIEFSVTKNGIPYTGFDWDEETRTFSTNADGLVLDFSGVDGVTFNTGSLCTFNTGNACTFNTHWGCTFNTGSDCTFDTDSHCTFDTGSECTFKAGPNCNFKTGSDCTFNTGSLCTFNTGNACTFNTGPRSVVVRRDVFEVIQVPEGKTIKLNGMNTPGYRVINPTHKITIDGKEIELSEESYNKLCESLVG